MIKYIVYPGEVESRYDGDYHRISFWMLCKLYGINPKDCINGDKDMRGINTDKYIRLRPVYSGDYIGELKRITEEK